VTAEVRREQVAQDHHLQHHGGEGVDQGLRAGAGHAVWGRGPDCEAGAGDGGIEAGQGFGGGAGAAKAYETDAQIKELIDTAKKLEGLARGSGVHASAVVIAPRPLTELCRWAKTKKRRNRDRIRYDAGVKRSAC